MTYKRTFICNVGFYMNFLHIKGEMTFKLSKATCFSFKKRYPTQYPTQNYYTFVVVTIHAVKRCSPFV